jgi:hypothetical protein
MTNQEILFQLSLPFIWALNGLLAVLYLLLEHITAVALIPGLGWLCLRSPKPQQRWMFGAALLALAAAIFAPAVVGLWLLLMVYASIVSVKAEKFNPPALHWRVISGLAAYALIGLGFTLYQNLSPALLDPYATFAQGKGYFDIILSIAVFLGPLSFIGLLVQALFAHPPLEGTPESVIASVRTRGLDR